ncbi:NAD-dependent epimerase/dehydratase family protein [Brassicibacter mesophilus]|uniref:NAD-dependent epimerase/dehydratase family protein n=1 Tax=Brassicibacter mesophilus TaxID=745119 RepID=UPI003D22D033
MEILVLGGTRFFGIHMVRELLRKGHQVTIATRGRIIDEFGDSVKRIIVERTNPRSLLNAFKNKSYDVVCDNLAYCSNDVRYILDSVKCKRYIMVSSAAVYNKHFDTKETEFNPIATSLKWCSRGDFPYDEIKRQAECALFQNYSFQNAVAVRYPFVVGEDDYTKRMYFYVEHIVKGIPMFVDNREKQLGFICSDEAGKFLAYLTEQEFCGTINGSSYGTISISEIDAYIEKKTGIKAIYTPDGDAAPYNGEDNYSINTETARSIGFDFSVLNDWIYDLLDKYIKIANDI